MLATTATRAATRAVARRGFHTTRAQQSSPYHYPEGPYTNLPFNTKTRFFAVRYWTFMAVGFGAPFGIAGAFFFFFPVLVGGGADTVWGCSLADVSSSLVSGVWTAGVDGGREVGGGGYERDGKADGGCVYAMLRRGSWIGDTLSMSTTRADVSLSDSARLELDMCMCGGCYCEVFCGMVRICKRNGAVGWGGTRKHGNRMVGSPG